MCCSLFISRAGICRCGVEGQFGLTRALFAMVALCGGAHRLLFDESLFFDGAKFGDSFGASGGVDKVEVCSVVERLEDASRRDVGKVSREAQLFHVELYACCFPVGSIADRAPTVGAEEAIKGCFVLRCWEVEESVDEVVHEVHHDLAWLVEEDWLYRVHGEAGPAFGVYEKKRERLPDSGEDRADVVFKRSG